jgi:hypothetical protein
MVNRGGSGKDFFTSQGDLPLTKNDFPKMQEIGGRR